MEYLILIALALALLWIVSIAWANRRKSPYDSGSISGDGGSGYSTHCDSTSDGGCGGDGGGGD